MVILSNTETVKKVDGAFVRVAIGGAKRRLSDVYQVPISDANGNPIVFDELKDCEKMVDHLNKSLNLPPGKRILQTGVICHGSTPSEAVRCESNFVTVITKTENNSEIVVPEEMKIQKESIGAPCYNPTIDVILLGFKFDEIQHLLKLETSPYGKFNILFAPRFNPSLITAYDKIDELVQFLKSHIQLPLLLPQIDDSHFRSLIDSMKNKLQNKLSSYHNHREKRSNNQSKVINIVMEFLDCNPNDQIIKELIHYMFAGIDTQFISTIEDCARSYARTNHSQWINLFPSTDSFSVEKLKSVFVNVLSQFFQFDAPCYNEDHFVDIVGDFVAASKSYSSIDEFLANHLKNLKSKIDQFSFEDHVDQLFQEIAKQFICPIFIGNINHEIECSESETLFEKHQSEIQSLSFTLTDLDTNLTFVLIKKQEPNQDSKIRIMSFNNDLLGEVPKFSNNWQKVLEGCSCLHMARQKFLIQRNYPPLSNHSKKVGVKIRVKGQPETEKFFPFGFIPKNPETDAFITTFDKSELEISIVNERNATDEQTFFQIWHYFPSGSVQRMQGKNGLGMDYNVFNIKRLDDMDNGAVLEWLSNICDGKFKQYVPVFKQNEVYGDDLLSLNDDDLKVDYLIQDQGHRSELLSIIKREASLPKWHQTYNTSDGTIPFYFDDTGLDEQYNASQFTKMNDIQGTMGVFQIVVSNVKGINQQFFHQKNIQDFSDNSKGNSSGDQPELNPCFCNIEIPIICLFKLKSESSKVSVKSDYKAIYAYVKQNQPEILLGDDFAFYIDYFVEGIPDDNFRREEEFVNFINDVRKFYDVVDLEEENPEPNVDQEFKHMLRIKPEFKSKIKLVALKEAWKCSAVAGLIFDK